MKQILEKLKSICICAILLSVLFSNNLLLAESLSPEKTFAKANDFYKKGEYDNAIQVYEEILSKGNKSSEIYFNLANSYYRTNKIAFAILNYERALKLSPDDEDIKFNLNVSNLKIIDKINPVPKFFVYQWLDDISRVMSGAKWGTVAIVSFWICCISFAAFLYFYSPFVKKLTFAIGTMMFFFTVAFWYIASTAANIEYYKSTAIITSPSVYIKSSPDNKSTDLFILHEGAKVSILEHNGTWKRIKLADGNQGWVDASGIEQI
jgi:tetratricopeptide (TPR) repeat protein